MNEDHLLKHADRVIRENQIIREECRRNLMQARAASVCIERTLQLAKTDAAMARQGLEAADRIALSSGMESDANSFAAVAVLS